TFTASIDGGPPPEAKDRRDIAATPDAERWQGWGTALKPAFEPIVLARKPLAEKTVARNVLEHGTGAINIDACRIHATPQDIAARATRNGTTGRPAGIHDGGWKPTEGRPAPTAGRWPANVLLDHHAAAWVDEQSGVSKS